MFDIGWSELLIIGLVALIVVGPKDLPIMFRRIGQWVGRMRNMARDFQRAMDQAADEAGVKDIRDGIKDATNMQDKIFGDASESLKNFQKEVEGTKEIKKIDAAAEHAKRVKMAEEANKAAESWDYTKDEPTEATAVEDAKPKAAPKKAPAKKAAKKTPARKPATKKAPAKTTSQKSSSKSTATKAAS